MKGQNTKSIRKKSLTNTRNPVVGVKNIKFKHQASAGEQYIDLTSLTAPSGFSNPSTDTLAKVRLKDFSENLVKFTSSAKGEMTEGVNEGFQFISNTTIKLKEETFEGEIFEFIFNNAVINGTLIADVRTPGATGTLLESETDFNLGEAIPIKELNNDWPIQLFRGTDGKPMTRNTLNGTSGGNYQMIDDGTGHCQVIRFNIAGDVGGEPILWASHGALGERPNLSVLQQNENVLGIVNRMKDDLLEATGFNITDPTRYDGVPANADLKAFGDKVQKNIQDILKIINYKPEILYDSNNTSVNGSTTAGTFTDAGLSLSLGIGRWKVEAGTTLYMTNATGAGASGRRGVMSLTDSSNNQVADINGANVGGTGGFANAASPWTMGFCGFSAIIDVTSPDTYKIRFSSLENSAPTTISQLALWVFAANQGMNYLKATKIEDIKTQVGV